MSQNPFDGSYVTKPSPFTDQGAIDYLKNFTFLFDSPNWFVNLLLLAVIQIIPILGPIVMLGYQYEVTEFLIRSPGSIYPDVDFGRFGKYLSRGIWPFLVGLIGGAVLFPAILACYFGFGIGVALAGPNASGIVAILGVMVFVFGVVIVSIGVNLVMLPMALQSGLSQELKIDFQFAQDFLKLTFKELVIGVLLIILVSPIVTLMGMLALCVGFILALPLISMAYGYLHYQLYRLYLSRGGAPVPFKA